MTFHPSSFIKRIVTRLGLDPRQEDYFFRLPNARSEKGSMVALAAVFMLIMSVLIPVTMTLVASVHSNTAQAQLNVAGAQNAAKAGLEDALGWFVRQNKVVYAYTSNVTVGATPTYAAGTSYVDQPFAPVFNGTNPAYSDTFQATTVGGGITSAFLGICNEYSVDSSSNSVAAAGQSVAAYYGRYEVAEQPNPFPSTGPTYTPSANAVHDISGNREPNYINGDGLVWAINSVGYIYLRKNFSTYSDGEWKIPYNVYPNKVLATAKAYTELRKLSCNVPNGSASYAGIYCQAATYVSLNGYSRLNGNVPSGYALCSMTGSVTQPSGAGTTNFFGNSVIMSGGTSTYLSDTDIFGMSIKDIQFIADYTGNTSTALNIVGNNKLSYYNGNLSYGATQAQTVYQQLNSTGILVVNGTLDLEAGSATIGASYYAGVVFVTGNLTIGPGCDIDGLIVMGNSTAYTGSTNHQVVFNGSQGNFATVNSNPSQVIQALDYVAQYREDISARRVILAFPGI